MNTQNKKRKRESQNKIESAFVNLLLFKEFNEITVTDICKVTGLNRTTFYANYDDLYDLASKVKSNMEADFNKVFSDRQNHNAVTLFKTVYENQAMFKMYFKLGYDKDNYEAIYDIDLANRHFGDGEIKYHIEFFKSGLNAIIKLWLENGCAEAPEEMAAIVEAEYRGRKHTSIDD